VALTAEEPWLFTPETVQRARAERRRYIQEASQGWLVSLGGVDVVIAGLGLPGFSRAGTGRGLAHPMDQPVP